MQVVTHSIGQSSYFVGVWEYIQTTRDQVIELETCVQKAKDNVEQIVKLMSTWSKTPLFDRKEDKHETLLNLDDRKDRLEKRYGSICDIGEKIHHLLQVFFFYKTQIVKLYRFLYIIRLNVQNRRTILFVVPGLSRTTYRGHFHCLASSLAHFLLSYTPH